MPSTKLNILIYAGPGAIPTSIRHITYTLRRLLGPNYAIITITAPQLLHEPWPPTCALLVIPGGADLAYCRALDGAGNRRIKQYVRLGGSFLGLCAGGYYGSARCEFEVGKRVMEVVGDRELAFYPGVCRGLAFGGFVYNSEAGARAVKVQGKEGEAWRSYYNGGGVFVDVSKFEDKGVEVLATYGDELAVESGEGGGAAVVLCKVGEGNAVLTGPHPEFAPDYLNPDNYTHPDNRTLIDDLKADEIPRAEFLRTCLRRLGLEVSDEAVPVPSLSRLHLSSAQPSTIAEIVETWYGAGIVVKEDGEEVIKGENDTFYLEQVGRWNMASMARAVTDALPQPVQDALPSAITPSSSSTNNTKKENVRPRTDSYSRDSIPDYNALPKHLVAHENALPEPKETPHFNHHALYSNLQTYRSQNCREANQPTWANTLLYGEVVTSTNTLLEKNPSLLAHIPTGLVATATTQVAGRGRGTNVWVSPPGSLMFSVVTRHPLVGSPVVFVQYLAALAIVAGIQGYAQGYARIPVKLKWPNDIYALDPTKDTRISGRDAYVKIGGILVNSSYAGGDYTLVTGIGLNVNNARSPTAVSLSQLAAAAGLPDFTLEKLLASIITHFEELYTRFCRTGFDSVLEKQYYDSWLHAGQIVTLEAEGGVRAKVLGITTDWGMLKVMEEGGRRRTWEVMSDGNSFDFFKGLVRKKT